MTTQPPQPTIDDLLSLALGELDTPGSDRVRTAMARFPDSAAVFRRVQSMLVALRGGVLQDPPRDTVLRAMAIWPSRDALTLAEWLSGAVERVMSVLFDSGASPALAGFRGGSESRHVSFSDGGVEIEVLVETVSGESTIQGQVVGAAVIEVAAFSPESLTLLGRCGGDAQGGFRLSVAAPSCDLRVRTGVGVFALPGVIRG